MCKEKTEGFEIAFTATTLSAHRNIVWKLLW